MITYRLRGLVNLHIAITTLLAGGFFLLYARFRPYLPWVQLDDSVPVALYFACVIGGMLASGKYLNSIGSRYNRLTWADALRLASRQVLVMLVLVFALMAVTKDRSISRLFLATYFGQAWILLTLVNGVLPRYLARAVFYKTHRLPTLFVGSQRSLERLRDWVAHKQDLGIQPVGFLSDEVAAEENGVATFLGPTDKLARVLVEKKVGQVIVLDVPGDRVVTRRLVETCQAEGCRLLIYDNMAERLPVPMTPVAEEGHFFYTMREEPLEDPVNRIAKRLFDIALSLPIVVIVLPPLCLWVWLMQRWQAPGPLLFVRSRGGQNRNEFQMLKFRSMYHADADVKREAQQARANDDRVYPFGRFLRKTSLDEFPQFLNVLFGTMSIVGPRPHLPKHDDEFALIERTYRTRALVKPGITGLAQTSGFRGEIVDPAMLRRRVEMDLRYITSWSVWLDLEITMKTLWQVFFPPKTAY